MIGSSQNKLDLEPMQPTDWTAVRAIYAEGIATGNATFEMQVPSWETWDANHLPTCRLVAKLAGNVVGWVALSLVSKRQVYAGVAEHSIYVASQVRGRGIGRQLLQALIEESEQTGIWTIQTSIFPENTASIDLHRTCGFREVGYREKIGQMNGIWRDVIFLERRSKSVGS